MNLEVTTGALEALDATQDPALVSFSADFVSKLGSGIARCLDAGNKSFTVKSGNTYDLFFLEPGYVASVEIEFSKPVVGATIELSIHDSLSNRNVRRKVVETSRANSMQFVVNCVTSGISLYLQPTILELLARRTIELKNIKILGFTAKDFETLTESLTRLQSLRNAALEELTKAQKDLEARHEKLLRRETAVEQLEVQKEEQLEGLQERIDQANSEAVEAESKLNKLRDDISRGEARKQGLADQISTHEATVRSIEGEISKGKEQLRALAVETSEKQHKLRELTSNVNLFSEEFGSFSDHGAKQARIFIYLSIVPLAIITLLTLQLLLGAVDLSVKYVEEPNLDLLTVFVTRLPYLTVCGSILALCYSAIGFLFRRISIIYAERLDFSKIGILAKDVASASAYGLQLKDEQLYEARTYLKIEMLKSYLSGNIGAFTYVKRELGKAGGEVAATEPTSAPSAIALDRDDGQ